ncbi:hypothetical protein D3C81_1640840 [compost metagenome]
MTPTNAAIGICFTTLPRTKIKNNKNTPDIKVDNRERPPDLTLITVCPIIAQPAMPPKNPDTTFAIPCPRTSLFLSLFVSVISSTIVAVIRDSVMPTTANAREKGKMLHIACSESSISGTWKNGRACDISPISPPYLLPYVNQDAGSLKPPSSQ